MSQIATYVASSIKLNMQNDTNNNTEINNLTETQIIQVEIDDNLDSKENNERNFKNKDKSDLIPEES